jgi:hypothetical protein
MVSYRKPKHGSTGKTKKLRREHNAKKGERPYIGLPHDAAQLHDQPVKFNRKRAKLDLGVFRVNGAPKAGEPHATRVRFTHRPAQDTHFHLRKQPLKESDATGGSPERDHPYSVSG